MFSIKDGSIVVDVPVLEILVPETYSSNTVNGFTRKGEFYDMFCVVMGYAYKTQESYKNRKNKINYKPITLPYIISTKPSTVENDIVELPLRGSEKKVFKLTYYKGDIFSKNVEYIKLSDNTQRIYNLIDNGKGDFLPYTAILKVLEETHYYNGTQMPVGIEVIEAMVAEKSRDPQNYSKPARTMDKIPYAVQTLNPREQMITNSTFNMLGFEDVNTSVLVMANKKEKGIVDKPSTLERIILGNTNPQTLQ